MLFIFIIIIIIMFFSFFPYFRRISLNPRAALEFKE